MLKKILKTAAVLAMVVLTACAQKDEGNISTEEKIIITHDLGTTEITGKPTRVVVFDYGVLDILSHIDGVEIVGVPKSTSFPAELSQYDDSEKYPTVGTLFEPNFEKLFELNPDLIIMSRRQIPVYDDLAKVADTLYQKLGETYFEDLAASIDTLGDIFGQKEMMQERVEELTKNLADIRDKSKDKTALFVLANGGTLSVYGEGSRYDHLYSAFGFTPADDNIDESTHGNRVSYEYFHEMNPDYLFILDRGAVVGTEITARDTVENDIMRSLEAYKNDQIIYLSPNPWYLIMGGLDSSETIVNEVEKAFR